jgi:outer membrane protein OmpA-like peptidoglycan-associated protein
MVPVACYAPPMSVEAFQWNTPRRSAFRVERWSWSLRLWALFAFALALLFHWWLFLFFNNLEFGRQMLATSKKEPKQDRLKIDPKVLKEQQAVQEIPDVIIPAAEPAVKADFQDIVEMLPENRELDLTPEVNKVTNFLAPDSNPMATTPAQSPSLAAVAESIPGPDLANAMSAVKSSTLASAVSAKQLVLPSKPLDKQIDGVDGKLLDSLNKQSQAGNAAAQRLAGYSNLDDLVARGGNVHGGTAPIMLPTDLLFEYNSDQLAENARLSLMKLGLLIMKNPNSVFIIEGHTDTLGTEAYNFDLSQRRANAVVQWLINSLRIQSDRIRAVGMGETRPLPSVDPRGTAEEQALNRRVEIKVRPLR